MGDLGLRPHRPFHRALDDAYYTGKLLTMLGHEPGPDTILPFLSVDYYRLPADKKEEIRMTFPAEIPSSATSKYGSSPDFP